MKLVHLVGFITKKFITMHGHMNVKKYPYLTWKDAMSSPNMCNCGSELVFFCILINLKEYQTQQEPHVFTFIMTAVNHQLGGRDLVNDILRS